MNLAENIQIVALVRERQAARAKKDYARADAIRDEILALGWRLEDSITGPRLTPDLGDPIQDSEPERTG